MKQFLITMDDEKLLVNFPDAGFISVCFPNAISYVEVQG